MRVIFSSSVILVRIASTRFSTSALGGQGCLGITERGKKEENDDGREKISSRGFSRHFSSQQNRF